MMLRKCFLLFLNIFCLLAIENVVQTAGDVRIFYGTLAYDQKQFAYQASLTQDDIHFCGGTIINSNHILTAAHCVYDNKRPANIKVKVGSLTPHVNSTTRTVKTIFVHPGFDNDTLQHDVAILKIKSLGNWTNGIKSIALAKYSPKAGTNCIVAGWGVTEYSEFGSHSLKYTNVPIVPRRKCKGSYGHKIRKEMFCAGYWQGGPDSCQGDSGGGIICNGELSGIVSWGHNCGEKTFPGVYADVSYYLGWIHAKSGSSKLSLISLLILPVILSLVFAT